MMTELEYQQNERKIFLSDLKQAESGTLAERREAQNDWLKAMRETPELVGERCGWILNGSYGKGSYDAAWEVAQNKRMNRVAWFGQTIAALEWLCPRKMAMAAWKNLSESERAKVSAAIESEIEQALKDRDPEPLTKQSETYKYNPVANW